MIPAMSASTSMSRSFDSKLIGIQATQKHVTEKLVHAEPQEHSKPNSNKVGSDGSSPRRKAHTPVSGLTDI
jgi:hypothetical protein